MTAPDFPDKDEVDGFTLGLLRDIARESDYPGIRWVRLALKLWEQRDEARATAVAQDAAAQKVQVRLHDLEHVLAVARDFQERGYESGFKEMNEALAKVRR